MGALSNAPDLQDLDSVCFVAGGGAGLSLTGRGASLMCFGGLQIATGGGCPLLVKTVIPELRTEGFLHIKFVFKA